MKDLERRIKKIEARTDAIKRPIILWGDAPIPKGAEGRVIYRFYWQMPRHGNETVPSPQQ